MSIELATKYAPYTDEVFSTESKLSMLTNTDFDWEGAKTVKIWKISTAAMNDYDRTGSEEDISRFGKLMDLGAQTESMLLKKDRSFIFNIDKLDEDETEGQLSGATALARQIREKVIPEVDSYVYGVMVGNAGTAPAAKALDADNIYSEILAGSEVLDDAEVPETERVLLVSSKTYNLMKKSKEIILDTDVGQEMRGRGVIGMLDGMAVAKVASVRLPANFGFMIAHPSATVAPVKLEDYGMHNDTPLSSGTIVTGRICYDAFVLENKVKGIYYQAVTA